MKEITTDSGKKIYVFDDLLSFEHLNDAYTMCKLLDLSMGWNDTNLAEAQHHRYLHAPLSLDDLPIMSLDKYFVNSPITPLLDGLRMTKAVLNVTVTSDCHYTHTHAEKLVVLFYINLEWKDGWHGETLFFSNDGKEIVYASRYTPGRVIAFDGSIPHSIRPQSREGPQYRYTFASIFDTVDKS